MPPLAAAQVIAHWMRQRRATPVITYYGPDGARVELSGASTENAINKAVNLFTFELLLEAGDVVWLDLPCHWQAPILAISAWAAGLTVAIGPHPPTATAATIGTGSADRPIAGIPLAVSMHPWGLPLGPATPAGWEDFAALARSQPDQAALPWPAADVPWLLAPTPLADTVLLEQAVVLGEAWGLPQAGRLLTTLPPLSRTGLLACTLVPALAQGAVVLVAGLDVAEISRQERNDATATGV